MLNEEFKEFVKKIRWFKQFKESNFYLFWYKFVYEIVVYYYGLNYVDDLLVVMGFNFILEKIRLGDGRNMNKNELFFDVNVLKFKNRLFYDIYYYVNYLYVFLNNYWKSKFFCDVIWLEL